MRSLRILPLLLTALLAVPALAAARPAPLDVRLSPVVLGAKLGGVWTVGQLETDPGHLTGSWEGDAGIEESWRPAGRTSTHVRRPASARGERTFTFPVRYRRVRTTDGDQLHQLRVPEPLTLTCGATGGRPEVTETVTTTMRAIDQPAKNRVVFMGPDVEIPGPTCIGAGGESRSLEKVPRDPADPELPVGAVRGWRIAISRPAVAAGGLLHFQGSLFSSWVFGADESGDVAGSASIQGRIFIDVLIEPAGGWDR